MAKIRFTDANIRALPVPGSGHRIDYAESDVRGFAVQTTYAGARRFLLVYVARKSGRERRMVLGEFGSAPRLSVSAARKLAGEKRALVDLGHDPWLEAKIARAEAEAAAVRDTASLGALMTSYVRYLKEAGKASWRDVERAIERHLTPQKRLVATAADQITVDDVMPVFHGLAKEGKLREAEKLRAYLRAAYTAARKARTDATMHTFAGFQIRENPLLDLDVSRPKEAAEKAATAARERKWALSEAQLQAYWRRIHAWEGPEGALLTLHLLTGGQRVEQLGRLNRTDYDPDAKTVTLRDTKGRRQVAHEHIVPLLPEAEKALAMMRRVIRSDHDNDVQPGPFLVSVDNGNSPAAYHKVWELVQKVAAAMVEAQEVDRLFTPGTIRKTVETRLAARGVPDEVLARLLSHGLGGVQARNYNAHRYDDEKRSALRKLRAMCEASKGKVVEFKKSG